MNRRLQSQTAAGNDAGAMAPAEWCLPRQGGFSAIPWRLGVAYGQHGVRCRAIVRHGIGGGGAWRHPRRDAAGDANGRPCIPPADRPAAFRRRQPAAPQPGGRFLGTPMGVLSEPPLGGFRRRPDTAPPIGGTVYGACNCRHGMWCRLVRCRQLTARCTMPPFGGTVYRRRIRRRSCEPPARIVPPIGGTVSVGGKSGGGGGACVPGCLGASFQCPAYWPGRYPPGNC